MIVNNEDNIMHFATTTEEIIRVQLFLDSFLDEIKELTRVARNVLKKEKDILDFDVLEESIYEQWKFDHSIAIEQLHMTYEDKMKTLAQEEGKNLETVQVTLS